MEKSVIFFLVTFGFIVLSAFGQDKCSISNEDKVDCHGNQATCEGLGCCWQPIDPNPSNLPWCYYSTDYEDPCKDFTWTGDGPGFTDDFYNIMFQK